jgi:uncharacterized membrane protein
MPHPLPADTSVLDVVALLTLVLVWSGYGALLDGRWRRQNSINSKMICVREAWMRQLLARDNRITDATLIGHAIRTATFFASTTIILVAGLVGVLGSADQVHAAAANFSVLFGGASQALFEIKVFVLIVIFIYAFFKFTWAIRQFNYFSAVVGGAPAADGNPVDRDLALRMARIFSFAVWQLNAGVRAYYYAFAALGWLVHPLLFLAMTVTMTLVMVRRQLFSRTARAIGEHVDALDPEIQASARRRP